MKHNNKVLSVILNIFFVVLCLICVYPVLMVIGASITSESSLIKYGYHVIPKEFSLDAYKYIFTTSTSIGRAYINTIVVTVASVIIGVLATAMYAYVISRKDFKHRNLFSFISFFTMLFNGGLVASYLINVKVFALSNSIWALILPGCVGAWNILVLKSFFATSIPYEIIESGKIDGASEIRIFFELVFPISLPGLATIALFVTMGKWNDWMNPMLYITEESLYTVSFLLQNMLTNIAALSSASANVGATTIMQEIPSEGARMALCMVAVGPMLVVYPFFQKYFIQGMTVGSVKG